MQTCLLHQEKANLTDANILGTNLTGADLENVFSRDLRQFREKREPWQPELTQHLSASPVVQVVFLFACASLGLTKYATFLVW
ncbi:pentapeptide repeat-containing protein [Nostoc sp. FACHB-888]|nr:pentapeptide repeat-containing protein [Nostoc sp. FACHB-888]